MNISFRGNIKPAVTINQQPELVLPKKEFKRSQKRALEAQVVPDEVSRIIISISILMLEKLKYLY